MQPEVVAIVGKIDRVVEAGEYASQKGRTHLGASVLGEKCARQVWYGWRWAHITQHTGRLLRLFQRGHREEAALVAYFDRAGWAIRPYAQTLWYHAESDCYLLAEHEDEAPAAAGLVDVTLNASHVERAAQMGQRPRQALFSELGGHYGGSGDGAVSGPCLPSGWGLLEFKTHNEKSFCDIAGKLLDWRKYAGNPAKHPFTGKGLNSSKPRHYIQMQLYMAKFGYAWGLYVAICKNTDDIYVEVVRAKPEMAAAYDDRAKAIITAQVAPPRITNDPSWFVCKFCDFREICHHDKLPHKSCRSCQYAAPDIDEEGAVWRCARFNQPIPPDFIAKGCEMWEPLV